MFKALMIVLATLLVASPVQAQRAYTHNLVCQGYFQNLRATVEGQRVYAPYNALGDGNIRFNGMLKTASWSTVLTYEGSTNLVPYPGFIYTKSGWVYIKVLDATGDWRNQMIIYEGRERLGAPEVFGRLTCRWTLVSQPKPR